MQTPSENLRSLRWSVHPLVEVVRLLAPAAVVSFVCTGCFRSSVDVLVVHAPASLADVMPDIARRYEAAVGQAVQLNIASTARLASQLESGAPGDVFLSADAAWMDHLEASGAVAAGARRDLLVNALVIVTPRSSSALPEGRTEALRLLEEAQRVAVAGESVPAGRYGRAALASLGLSFEKRRALLSADDVRTALSWVALEEADAGLVYETDALAEPRVRVAYRFADDDHPPIVYPIAILDRSERPAQAEAFVAFCEGDEARTLFTTAGFRPLPPGQE